MLRPRSAKQKEGHVSRDIEVLILDDEPIVCERLKDYLEKQGISVEVFTESRRALDRLKDKSFDVVVTDIRMEGPDGIDVLTTVKRGVPGCEVILITGYGSIETLRDAETVGAFAYIHKPFKLEEIHKKIKKAAAKARKHSS
jgi:DNA-binding NtrC family response regulator